MLTVLIVEDNYVTRTVLYDLLPLACPGACVVQAANGTAGYELALERKPDLVLIDVNLPDISGFDLAKKLRSHPMTSHIFMIGMTADETSNPAARSLRQIADEFLIKPFYVDQLLEVLNSNGLLAGAPDLSDPLPAKPQAAYLPYPSNHTRPG